MSERRDRHPIMTQLISDQERIDQAVSASLGTTIPIGRPEYIRFGNLLEAAPTWFGRTGGHPLKELQRLNSSELWHGIFQDIEFDPMGLYRERLFKDEPRQGVSNIEAIDIMSLKTKKNLGYLLPLFGLAALMGHYAYSYIEEQVDDEWVESPVIEPVVAMGRRFGSQARTPEIFIERMRKLFPPRVMRGDGSAMDLLIEMNAFKRKGDPRFYCPAPRLVVMMIEAFGRELENGYDQRLVAPLAPPHIEQTA